MNTHITVPSETDLLQCHLTSGHWCALYTALYPIYQVTWHLLALFQDDPERIKARCKVKTLPQIMPMAYLIQKHIWVLTLFEKTTIQIDCLEHTQYQDITSSFWILRVENACEVYAPTFLIPPTILIAGTQNFSSLIAGQLIGFDQEYIDVNQFRLAKTFYIKKLTPRQLSKVITHFHTGHIILLTPINSQLFTVDEQYPSDNELGYSWVDKVITIGTVVLGMVVVILVGGCAYAGMKCKIFQTLFQTGGGGRSSTYTSPKQKTLVRFDPKSQQISNENLKQPSSHNSASGPSTPTLMIDER